ncbi:MAG: flagellar basal body L-ring protein FlgH [Alphaproteobacteria bacterium]|nr:flagellar basal body L-ring protein FlgH [Alphaproteobacteria bacterium]
MRRVPRAAVLLAVLSALSACDTITRISEIGSAPRLSGIDNPAERQGWRQVRMPMPAPPDSTRSDGSLWRVGARSFFQDQRATRVGDIVTLLVRIEDQAELQNRTTRGRQGSESLGIPNILGLESNFSRWLPGAIQPDNLVGMNSSTDSRGSGQITRTEQVTLRVAATVVQVLPNGNLVVAGKQEVRVNSELRELAVSGIVRPQDIASDNTVRHDRMAEARIAYGGRGTISDMQRPRYGQEILDIVLPF